MVEVKVMAPAAEIQATPTSEGATHVKPASKTQPTFDVEKVKRNVTTELDIADKYGAPDHYINAQADTLWYSWQGSIKVKPLRFEAKTGTYVIALKTDVDAFLGKHRHRGPVTGYTVSGSWGYKEYSWTAQAGDYIAENPGTLHTLSMSAGAEVIFTVGGSIEFFEPDGTMREIMDLFSFWRMYVEHCEERDLPINNDLWY